jgi:hypothetical protein
MYKSEAFTFLQHFQHTLHRELPALPSLRSRVREIATSAMRSDITPHMRSPETAFLNTYVIPQLFIELQSRYDLTDEETRIALLSENFRHMPKLCSASPARKIRHPFDKTFSPNPSQVMAHWRSGKSNSLRQSCPDFALRSPCPFSVVFEGKYFEDGSIEKAESELVKSIYQAFFYRALPKVEGTQVRPPWDYEFSCLLACDASPEGTLKRTWDSLDPVVQAGFWEGANVYVMILRKVQ